MFGALGARGAVAAGAVLVGLMAATPASANGPCGQNFDGNTACPVNSPVDIPGSLVTDNENDYYVFHASRGTELSVTITDTEAPTCSTSGTIGCGFVRIQLTDAKGNEESGGYASSQPNNNITVPGKFAHSITTGGTYYLVVSGDLGRDANDNPTDVPYTLSVTASPNVVWPPPPVPCTVPALKPGATLGSVEQHLVASHCVSGTIKHAYNRRVRRGHVIALSPGSGTQLTPGAAVTIIVSKGPRPRKRHRTRA